MMQSATQTSSVATPSAESKMEPRPKLVWEGHSINNEQTSPSRPPSKSWMKYLWSFIPPMHRKSARDLYSYEYQVALTEDEDNDESEKSVSPKNASPKRTKGMRRLRKALISLPIMLLSLFGLLHILFVLCSRQSLFGNLSGYNDDNDARWANFVERQKQHLTYPTDATRDVMPIPCHSHNDYWRTVPLFDAIHWGCTSVEADVWLFAGESELLIGHNSASLSRNRTFRSLYVDPLVDLLDSMNSEPEFGGKANRINGIFDTDPEQTLVLLVDFKTNGHDLFPQVLNQLEPLRTRNYLSHWNGETLVPGAVTVVGTGNAPFDLIIAESKHRREIFFDAPLDKMREDLPTQETKHQSAHSHNPRDQGNTGTSHVTSPDDFNSTNSYYASVPFTSSIGFPWSGRLSSSQLEKIRGQIRGAKRRGLKARYWDTPAWPTSLRNYIWETLVKEGAEMLNVDDLRAAAKLDWSQRVQHGWFDG